MRFPTTKTHFKHEQENKWEDLEVIQTAVYVGKSWMEIRVDPGVEIYERALKSLSPAKPENNSEIGKNPWNELKA